MKGRNSATGRVGRKERRRRYGCREDDGRSGMRGDGRKIGRKGTRADWVEQREKRGREEIGGRKKGEKLRGNRGLQRQRSS